MAITPRCRRVARAAWRRSLALPCGTGWATRAALGLEQDQLLQQAQAEHAERLRLALWRLDSRIRAILAREDSRPFNHYSAIFAPPLALDAGGTPAPPGSVLEPSPLLHAELPPWMLLHFQTDDHGWESPQVLSNALRHTPVGGDVGVEIATQGGRVSICISNTGPQIPAEVLARLFSRFFRADKARSSFDSDGAGLGLAITRAIAEVHGGRVEAASADGVTRFTLHFPQPGAG